MSLTQIIYGEILTNATFRTNKATLEGELLQLVLHGEKMLLYVSNMT